MRNRANPLAAPPGRLLVRGHTDRRADDLTRHIGRVAVSGLDAMMIVARGHEDDLLAPRRLEHTDDVRRDQRPAREHSEVRGLEMREERVVALDVHHRLEW